MQNLEVHMMKGMDKEDRKQIRIEKEQRTVLMVSS
jgi:hypothetical protein